MMGEAQFGIQLHAQGSGYHNSERGWYLFDSLRESAGRPDYAWPTLYDLYGIAKRETMFRPGLMFLDEINALICRPYPRLNDEIPLADWNAFGAGEWEGQQNGISNDPGVWYWQIGSNVATENGLWMASNAPPNPSFGVALARYLLPADWVYSTLGEGYTRIAWGGGRFELIIPYHYPAMLYDALHGASVEIPARGGAVPGSGGAEGMQRLVVYVMHLGGKVLISFDDAKSWFVYSRGETEEAAINAVSSPVQVSHLGSTWGFRLIPIDFYGAAYYESKVFEKGYTPTSALEGGAGGGEAADWRTNTWDTYATPTVDVEIISGDDSLCQYRATLTPMSYSVGSTYFGHTPELYAVRLMNKPVCETIPSVEDPVIQSSDVMGIRAEDGGEVDANRATVSLDNNDGYYATLLEYLPIEIALENPDGVDATVFCGYTYLVDPRESHRGGDFLDVVCYSAALPLMETACTEAEPVFSGWTVGEAIEWAALRCGIQFSKATYDTGTILPTGQLGSRAWQPGAGRSWMEFLKQICEYERYYLRFSGWNLMYLPEPTAGSLWHFTDKTGYPGAPEGAIPMVNEVEVPRDPEQHRNQVVVIGQTVDGAIVSAKYEDAANIADIGWPKTVVISDPAYDTQERVNLVAARLYQQVKRFPPRQVSFRVDGYPTILPRQFCKLWGGQSAYHLQVFQITRVAHRWERATGKSFFSEVQAAWRYSGA